MPTSAINIGWAQKPNWAALLRDKTDKELVTWQSEGHRSEAAALAAAQAAEHAAAQATEHAIESGAHQRRG